MQNNKIKKKFIIGSWSWDGYKPTTFKEASAAIEILLENGFNEFDTSPSYGRGEEILAKLKKKNKEIIINTKCGTNRNFQRSFKKKDLIKGINLSLKKFGKINVLQLHNPRKEKLKNIYEIIDLLNQYKKKKLIKFTGISLARDAYFPMKILNHFDFIQDEFNLLRIDPLKKMKNYEGTLAARSIYANGILTQKFNLNSTFSKKDHRASWLKKQRLKNIYNQKKLLNSLSKEKIEKFSLDFVLRFKMFEKIIVGLRTKKQVKDFLTNIENSKKIDKKYIKKIIDLHKNNTFFNSKEKY